MRLRRIASLLLLASVALAAPGAFSREALPLPMDLGTTDGRLRVTVDLGPAFPAQTLHELGNGLSNVVAIYVTVVPEVGGQPVAVYGRIVEVLWDEWDESFSVTVKDPRAPQGEHFNLSSASRLRALLASARDIDLGPTLAFPPGRLLLEARVELNPVSKEQLQRTREYIASAGSRSGGSRSVLGAMASFLLREPAPEADVALFRSKPFLLSEVDR